MIPNKAFKFMLSCKACFVLLVEYNNSSLQSIGTGGTSSLSAQPATKNCLENQKGKPKCPKMVNVVWKGLSPGVCPLSSTFA